MGIRDETDKKSIKKKETPALSINTKDSVFVFYKDDKPLNFIVHKYSHFSFSPSAAWNMPGSLEISNSISPQAMLKLLFRQNLKPGSPEVRRFLELVRPLKGGSD